MKHRNRCLIVDDDPIFQIVSSEILRAQGFKEVDTASDGREGLEQIRSNDDYDLVLSDLNMPNMDGPSFIRLLGEQKYRGSVIIVSSEDPSLLKTVQSMAIMAGVRLLGSISKPLTEDALDALLTVSASQCFAADEDQLSVSEVMDAIKADQFVPYYQPKMDIESGIVTSVEVLARKTEADGSIIPPINFIECAEQHGLINLMTDQIIAKSIRDAVGWAEAGIRADLAFNLSPTMLTDRSLPDRLARQFQSAGIDLSRITLEVTENRLVEYGADTLEVLSRLRLKGFKLSVDDFGTGATSFEQLQLYPFNQLKIDKSFVMSALNDPFAEATVRTSAKLARLLKMQIVAEGVETIEELDFVRSCRIEVAQGFLIAKPMPADAAFAFLKDKADRGLTAA